MNGWPLHVIISKEGVFVIRVTGLMKRRRNRKKKGREEMKRKIRREREKKTRENK